MFNFAPTPRYSFAFKCFAFVQFILSVSSTGSGSCHTWPDNTTLPAVVSWSSCVVHTPPRKRLSWMDAKSYCSQHGGILLVNDVRKRSYRIAFVERNLKTVKGIRKDSCFWFGLRKNESTGEWRYLDGSDSLDDDGWRTTSKLRDALHGNRGNCGKICPFYTFWTMRGSASQIHTSPCDEPLFAICQFEFVKPEVHLETGSKSPPKPRVTKAYIIKELTCHKGLRLTSPPDWSIRAVTPTSCARICLDLLPECWGFNFNPKSRRCNGFSSFNGNAVRENGWTLWKMMPR